MLSFVLSGAIYHPQRTFLQPTVSILKGQVAGEAAIESAARGPEHLFYLNGKLKASSRKLTVVFAIVCQSGVHLSGEIKRLQRDSHLRQTLSFCVCLVFGLPLSHSPAVWSISGGKSRWNFSGWCFPCTGSRPMKGS